ncbi:MAG: methyltransferase domain-containing protein [Thermoleophilaceae bacterium]
MDQTLGTRVRRGVRAAEQRAHRMQRRALERRLGGVDFSGWGFLEDRGIEREDRTPYGYSPWLPIRAALRRLEPGRDDVLVDLGCGKGQALLVAAQFPFRRVIGVEIAEDWAEDARRNAERALPRLVCDDVRIDNSDALEWPIPDDLSVVYMYCPFTGDLFRRALDRLLDARDSRPRPMRLVYNYPWEHNAVLATGRATVVDVRPSLWPTRPRWWMTGNVIVTYELHSQGAPRPEPLAGRGRGRAWANAMERWSGPNDTRFVQEFPGRDLPPLYSDET